LLKADILANLYLQKIEESPGIKALTLEFYYSQQPEMRPDKVKQKIMSLLGRVNNGESFEKIADEVNEDSTKGKGGDLGWFKAGMMAINLEKAALALRSGQIGQEPIETEYGYHIIKCLSSQLPNGRIHARHIFLSTQQAKDGVSKLKQVEIEREMKLTNIKYPVTCPDDFAI
jgi:hypothetical protein